MQRKCNFRLLNEVLFAPKVTVSGRKVHRDILLNLWYVWNTGVARVVENVPFQNTKGKIIFSDISNEYSCKSKM